MEQRLWNYFNSTNGRVVGVIPYYGDVLSVTVKKFGPEGAFDRIVQILDGRDKSEIEWLAEVLSEWKPQTDGGKASRRDWKKRTEQLISDNVPDEDKAALKLLLGVLS